MTLTGNDEPQKETKLTAKQRAFVDFYMTNGFNGTQAAISAGYSENTAKQIAYENLTKPDVANEIKRLMRDFVMPAEEVMSRLTEHARGDLGDIWDEASGQVDWKKARALGKTGLIKKIKHKTSRVTRDDGTDVETFEDEIELHSVQSALQLLGKYHGQFTDKIEHSGTVAVTMTWADMIQQSRGGDGSDSES